MTMDVTIDANHGRRHVRANRFFALRPQYLLGGALILLLIGAVYAIVSNFLSGPPPKMKQVVHQISLLPPPPQIEQPPQPEIKEEVNIPEPQPVAQEDAPAPGDLGVDADGNGSDGFQLRARKGGRDLLGAGGPFAWYANRIEDSIKKVLSANKKARNANYVVLVKLWLNHDGSVERFELADSTGSSDLDQSIKLALAKVEPLGSELPADLKQPVRLRITSRQ
jgi:periplasmic protein TonB